MKLSVVKSKIKEYPFACICLLISFVLIVLLILEYTKKPTLEALLSQKRFEKGVLEFNKINAVDLDKNIKQLDQMSSDIKARLINPSEKTDNFLYFFNLEKQTGVKLENPSQLSVEPLPSPNTLNLAITTFSLQANGTFNQVLNFIKQLEDGKYLGRITRYTLHQNKTLNSELLNISVDLSFFGKTGQQ